jgi:hypothetical protein
MASRLQWIPRYGNDIYTKKESHPFLWNDSPVNKQQNKNNQYYGIPKVFRPHNGNRTRPAPEPNQRMPYRHNLWSNL